MEPLKCEECGRDITAGSKRCAHCGCPVEVMLGSTNTADICPKCGKSVEKNMKYCPNCGVQQNKTKSTPHPDTAAAKLNKPKSNNKSVTTEKQKSKPPADNLEIPIPPKPKIGKGIIIYTVIVLVLTFWLASIGIFEPVVVFLFFPIMVYVIAHVALLNNYKLAQTDYPKYVMKVKAAKARQEGEKAREKAALEAEYNAAVLSQKRSEPWAVRYSTSPCPHCGHYKVRHAKWEDKSMSVAFWGMASSTIGKNYKCEHCGRMW